MSKVIKLTNENFEAEALKSSVPVLIDFYAEWCGPCKMVSPVIDKIAEERDDVKVCKVNVDDEMELASRYGVMSIPTIVVMKNGEIASAKVGFTPKGEIEKMLS